jgi:hypothetical protein
MERMDEWKKYFCGALSTGALDGKAGIDHLAVAKSKEKQAKEPKYQETWRRAIGAEMPMGVRFVAKSKGAPEVYSKEALGKCQIRDYSDAGDSCTGMRNMANREFEPCGFGTRAVGRSSTTGNKSSGSQINYCTAGSITHREDSISQQRSMGGSKLGKFDPTEISKNFTNPHQRPDWLAVERNQKPHQSVNE